MLVSVIIASYNYEKYIAETLQSLIAQTHQKWECIVVDDGSKDNTRQVVTEFIERDKRIKYLYQNNAGQASARNNGLQIAKGKYVQFLDADDLLEPLKLERHVEFLEKHSDIDIVYGEARYFRTEYPEERRYSGHKLNLPWMPKISGKGTELIEKLIEYNIFTVSAPLIRKTVIDLIGEFDASLNPVEDWDYWMRCAIAGVSIKYFEAEGTKDLIRIHDLSATQNLLNARYKHFLMRVKFDKILPNKALQGVNLPLLEKCERFWIGGECVTSVEEINQGQLIKGLDRMWKTLRFNPSMFFRIAVHRINRFIIESTVGREKSK